LAATRLQQVARVAQHLDMSSCATRVICCTGFFAQQIAQVEFGHKHIKGIQKF